MGFRHCALVAIAATLAGACGPAYTAAATSPKPSTATPVAATPPPLAMPFEDVWFLNPTEGWALVLSGADHAVEAIHSLDGGATWSVPAKVTSLFVAEGDAPPHYGIRFISSQAGWVFGNGIFATSDGGQTWSDGHVAGSVTDLATSGNSAWAITGCDPRTASPCPSSLLAWDPATSTWKAAAHQPPGTSAPQHMIRISASRAFIAEQTVLSSALLRTDDGGAGWTTLAVPCQGFGMPLATLDGMHVWLVCPGQPSAGSQAKDVYTSADGGVTWTLRAQTEPPAPVGKITISGYAQSLALASNTTGFLGMNRGDLYRSVDGGATWIASGLGPGEDFFPTTQFVDAMHGWAVAQLSTMDMAGRVGLYRTADAGITWTLASAMPGTL